MSPLVDTAKALYGATRLIRFEKDGLDYFDVSIRGFWRSFSAAIYVAPLFAIIVALKIDPNQSEQPATVILTREIGTYVLSWLLFPVVVEMVTRTIDRRHHFVRYIVAYNWAAIPQYCLFTLTIVLGLLGFVSLDTALGLGQIVLIWSFVYSAYVAKTALDIPVLTASAIVFLDFILAIVLEVAVGF